MTLSNFQTLGNKYEVTKKISSSVFKMQAMKLLNANLENPNKWRGRHITKDVN